MKQLLSLVFYSLCVLGTVPLIGQASFTALPTDGQLSYQAVAHYSTGGSDASKSSSPKEVLSSDNSCSLIKISLNKHGIIVEGLDQAEVGALLVLSEDGQTSYYNCWGADCSSNTIPLAEGAYRVIAKHYTAAYKEVCMVERFVSIEN